VRTELQELYQDVVLDHGRHPRNFGPLETANRRAIGLNPLCGDQLTVELRLLGDRIDSARFQGSGCAISKASASLMTSAVKGLTQPEARALFEKFHRLITQGVSDDRELGKLAVLGGVAAFPARVKCASLAWHALKSALDGGEETVSTE
jgi:nitrogen fixation NifU-like protein